MHEQFVQTPTQGIPKSVDEITGFILSLQDRGSVQVYTVERRLDGGLKLSLANRISDKQAYILVGTGTGRNRYYIFRDRKSAEPADKQCYGTITQAVIEKLSPHLPAQKILVAHNGRLLLPSDQIIVRVKFLYTELWRNSVIDHKVSGVGEMKVEYAAGALNPSDHVLEEICRFARTEK